MQHLGEADVDEPQEPVIPERHRRRAHVGVQQPVAVNCIQCLARVEPDDKNLRRRQRTTTVEDVAKAAAGEAFADHEQHLAVVPLDSSPIVDRGNIGVMDLGRHGHDLTEGGLHVGYVAEVGVHHLQHDGALQFLVEGLEDGRLQPAAQP